MQRILQSQYLQHWQPNRNRNTTSISTSTSTSTSILTTFPCHHFHNSINEINKNRFCSTFAQLQVQDSHLTNDKPNTMQTIEIVKVNYCISMVLTVLCKFQASTLHEVQLPSIPHYPYYFHIYLYLYLRIHTFFYIHLFIVVWSAFHCVLVVDSYINIYKSFPQYYH